jgi:hypothetical protein
MKFKEINIMVVTYTIIALFAIVVGYQLFTGSPDSEANLTTLRNITIAAVAFHIGSSQGSKDKDKNGG